MSENLWTDLKTTRHRKQLLILCLGQQKESMLQETNCGIGAAKASVGGTEEATQELLRETEGKPGLANPSPQKQY